MQNEKAIENLAQRLSGRIVRPTDEDYDTARQVWNALFDHRPTVIAYCRNDDDVAAAVRFGRESDMPLSIRSGGHDYAGNSVCDGGLVIDVSEIAHLEVDGRSKTARVGPGVRWRDLDVATQQDGLAAVGATVSTVGVAGFALGGGSGHLSRKHGLCIDNVRGVRLVTAEGKVLRANEKENQDLFWALRGGGGNFGVVTSIDLQLHEVGPEVIGGQVVHLFDDARKVLDFYRGFMIDAPDDIQCYAFIVNLPPLDVFPAELHGKPAISLVLSCTRSGEEGHELVRPLREFGEPLLDAVQPMPYTALQQMFDEGMPKGLRWYSKALYMPKVTDSAVDTLLDHTRELPGSFSAVYFDPGNGAMSRVDPPATAFPHRSGNFGLHIFPGWIDASDDERMIEWGRGLFRAMSSDGDGGVYVNLLGHDEKERVRQAYGNNYERLVELKKKWDPSNLFRHNHNIEPGR